MGFMLLWFEQVALGLCLMAIGLRLSLRAPWLTLRGFIWVTLIAGPLCLSLLVVAAEYFLVQSARVAISTHGGAAGAAVVMTLGLAVLAWRGLSLDDQGQRRALSWSLPNLCLGLIAAVTLYSMTFWNLDLAVRQQMAAMRREAGTLAMSVAPPPVPDRENAALVYQQLFESKLAQKKPAKYDEWWTKISDYDVDFDARDPELVAYVRRHAPLLNDLRAATRLPTCSFIRDWSRIDIAMLLGETQNARDAARELALEARVEAAHGNVRLALEDLAAIHRLAEHIGQEPTMISQLVAFAVDSIASYQLEWVLQHHPVTEEELAALADWQPLSMSLRLQRAALTEEALGLATLSEFDDSGVVENNFETLGIPNWGPNVNPLYRVFLFSADVQMYRRFLREYRNIAIRPYAERAKAYQVSESKLSSTPVGIVTRLLLPALSQFDKACSRTAARQRLEYLALAAHRYRLKHGEGKRFPDSLEQLTEAGLAYIPLDPYDDQPLRMIRRDDALILYSIGPDQIDEQGAKFDFTTSKGDQVFVLKLPSE